MGLSLSLPVLRVSLSSLIEQSVGIAMAGAFAAVILNSLVEQTRRRKPLLMSGKTIEKSRSRTLVSGCIPFDNVPDLEMGMTISRASDDIDFDYETRSVATLPTSNCASKAASGASNHSSSQLASELDVLEMIPHMEDTPTSVLSGFWYDAETASPLRVVPSRSVVTSRSVLSGIHPEAPPQEKVPSEVNILTPEVVDPLDDHFHSERDAFQERALQADRDELLETGESLFIMGEMLSINGKREQALEVLQRAEFVQKRAVEEVIMEVADIMQQQGMKLKDRGNLPYLSLTLLGAAELLKASPTAANLKACSRVHFEYQPNFKRHGDLRNMATKLDSIFTIVRQDATALAQTLRAQAICHRQAVEEEV